MGDTRLVVLSEDGVTERGLEVADLALAYIDDGTPTPVTVANPLPIVADGAALDATLTGGTAKIRLVDNTSALITASNPLPVRASVPNARVRGTAAGTVTALSPGDKLHSILVMTTSGGQVTVTVFDDAADQCPVDLPYGEDWKGRVAPSNADIVIAGGVAYYRITYEAV